ncbi:MAG: zinc-dependent metalloprotease [Saprospiraceae bacterium]|nr:zinc-dependent metalloprotease [Saprospiraceae bacterium]
MKESILLILLLISTCSFSQTPVSQCIHQQHHSDKNYLDFNPCGTPPIKTKWMIDYQKNRAAFNSTKSSNNITYLPLSLHIVGNDDSTGYGTLSSILSAFCQVNIDFLSTGIQFFIEYPIRYIPNSSFYNHDSVIIGGGFMLQHNIANTTNCYFVSNPAGACGYNVLYGGLTVSYNCLSGHTFSHELGHAMGLQHTFFGWEGGHGYNGSAIQVFNDAAPDQVLYDYTVFKDTMWPADTIIVDTAEVEIVARTGPSVNCSTAADGFCDTDADYLAFRWPCNSMGNSLIQQLDPDTIPFYSKGANIMSYSYDNCQQEFSAEQAQSMNAFIQTNRQSHLYNQNPTIDSISISDLTMIEPANNAILNSTTGVTFRWNSVPGATHYSLKVCEFSCATGNSLMEEVLLTDTFYISNLIYPPRISFLPYRWQVMPFNESYTCAGLSYAQNFNTQIASGMRIIESIRNFSCYPNPVHEGNTITLEVNATKALMATIKLYSIAGQQLRQQNWKLIDGKNQFSLSPTTLGAGVYLIQLEIENRKMIKKIIISR